MAKAAKGKTSDKTGILKARLISALEIAHGNVKVACKAARISRDTHYRWLRDDDEYKKKVDGMIDIAIDFVEEMLFEQIKNNDTTAIIFYLKTIGKRRGYVERKEVTGKDGKDLYASMSEDEIDKKIAALEGKK